MKVSVVIPCYNRANLIGRAIASTLAQTVAPHEVIVVDDGSVDESASLAEQFCDPVRVVRQENAGASAARNRGIQEASGDWIAFLDSDDTWTEDRLQLQRQAIERFPQADLVFCDTKVVGPTRVVLESRFAQGGLYGAEVEKEGKFARYDRSIFLRMIEQSRVTTSAVLVRNGLPELEFPTHLWVSEDWALWLKLALRYTLVSVDQICVTMTQGTDNLTNNVAKLMQHDVLVLNELLSDPLVTPSEQEAIRRLLPRRQIAAIYHALIQGEGKQARQLLQELRATEMPIVTRMKYWTASFLPGSILKTLAPSTET